jgi:hypothetical protein
MTGVAAAAREAGIKPRVAGVPQVFLPVVDIRKRAIDLGLIPPSNQPLRLFAFELRWLAHRAGRRMRGLLQTRVRLPLATREHQAPTISELMAAIALVVLALPMALGFGAGLALHRVSKL